MQLHFLRAVGSAVVALGDAPSTRELRESIAALVALFRAMSTLPRKAVQGLWGELFLIARAQDPGRLARFWHASPDELFDFADGPARVEVKTSGDKTRHHHFRLEQLFPPAPTRVVIASLFVSPSTAGTSAHELLQEIHHRLRDVDLVLHVERAVAETLGTQWATAISARFDAELAAASLAFYDASVVPAPARNLPAHVSEVRFRSDMTDVRPLDVARLREEGELYRSAIPRR